MELIINIHEGFHNPMAIQGAQETDVAVSHFTVVFETSCVDASCVIYIIEVNSSFFVFKSILGHCSRKSSECLLPFSSRVQWDKSSSSLVSHYY